MNFRPSGRVTPRRALVVVAAGLLLVAAAAWGSIALGVEHVSLARAFADPSSVDGVILFQTRLTRVALGLLVGAALAPAGAAFQALLRNPLADPYVLGISGGASVMATLAIVLGLGRGLLGE